MNLIVTAGRTGALLNWGAGVRRAAIGPGGIAVKGGEGDGITPRGIFPVREIFYLSRRARACLCAHFTMMTAGATHRAIPTTTGW
jgi:L,D-peptidoglycan transpeptidase YkuD (ErfK/YbiS/YcfS/YnhG family)